MLCKFRILRLKRCLNQIVISASRFGSAHPRVLAHDIYESNAHSSNTIIFLHGILGSKRNWRTTSREFVRQHSHYNSITMDHRGHGVSPTFDDHGQHTVDECAMDVIHTLEVLEKEPSIVCGHSFSGKVVLKCLDYRHKNDLTMPAHAWILDSLPGLYREDSESEESVSRILSEIHKIPQREFPNKDWIIDYLLKKRFQTSIVLWIATNLVPVDPTATKLLDKGGCKFSFDIDTVVELFEDFCHQDVWGILEDYDGPSTIHYLRAGRNNAWTDDVLKRFDYLCGKNPNIKLHTMPHVGHWLHTEDVHGMISLISEHSQLNTV